MFARGGGRGGAALVGAWVAAATVSGCAAHLPAAGERVAFLERTTVSVSSDRTQAFEVDPAVHLLLWNGLEDRAVLDDGGFATVGSASFLGGFRLLRGESTPMRVPTYEPRAKLQLFHGWVVPARGDTPAHRWLGELDLFVGHRSNGQDGCALAHHARYGDSDFACAPTTDPPDDRLDTRSGSFTTNYVGTGTGLLWAAGGERGREPAAVLAANASVEWNVACGFGACMPHAMRVRYGAALIRWALDAQMPTLWRISLAHRDADLGLRVSVAGVEHVAAPARGPFGEHTFEVALLARPKGGVAAGIFLRRQWGSDPLNIRFEERLDAWSIGWSFEPTTIAPAP